jgi:hypothetical protein
VRVRQIQECVYLTLTSPYPAVKRSHFRCFALVTIPGRSSVSPNLRLTSTVYVQTRRSNQSGKRILVNFRESQAAGEERSYFVDLGAHGAEEDARDFMETSILILKGAGGSGKIACEWDKVGHAMFQNLFGDICSYSG